MDTQPIQALTDAQIISGLDQAVAAERRSIALVLAFLKELDRRSLWKKEAYSSLFEYCVKRLKYAEGAAYKRITAARKAAQYPELLSLLEDGKLSLGVVSTIVPHLTPENRDLMLNRCEGKTVKEAEIVVAELFPQPDVADLIRAVADSAEDSPAGSEPAVSVPAAPGSTRESLGRERVKPIAARRFHFSFTGSDDLRAMIDRAKQLLRHKYPKASLEEVIGEMALAFLEQRDPGRRLAVKTKKPRPKRATEPRKEVAEPAKQSRHVPAEVARKVWARDQGQCAFISAGGRRCEALAWLEIDHIVPWAMGGASDDPDNLRLLCRTHNQFHAELIFGDAAARAHRGAASGGLGPPE
jgi:hypothetical protein